MGWEPFVIAFLVWFFWASYTTLKILDRNIRLFRDAMTAELAAVRQDIGQLRGDDQQAIYDGGIKPTVAKVEVVLHNGLDRQEPNTA